ncbi:diguanylate cyclase/phosphodiesterase domain 1 (ggdef) [hydrocarbon metagenome]|uniref:Diguanylate cyclase/phosphodiesterase domain 1 (Ggdef) n=1 Tax=hydrocarbon metagenome TaxID=938273 RepID=A0A0W8FLC6_9ZZZZ
MPLNPSPGATILCIDDDSDILNLLEKILSGIGYNVIKAADGKQGISEALTRKPDLILLDIVMPGMDGYEICKKIKDKEETKNIPIIFITAKKEDEDEAKGLKIGAVDYIRKPLYPPIIKSRIRTQLDLKLKTDMLERLVSIDGLTNIYNRRKFDETLKLEWKRALRNNRHLSLIMSDIDHFKGYNDHYGHTAGDDCLRRVSQGLKNLLQRPADLLARYGGEEFAVILPETDYNGAIYISKFLLKGIEDLNISYPHSPVVGHVTISIGIATSIPGKNCDTPLHLIEAADSMLYVAKQNGRNQIQGKDLSFTGK